jgi:hypothetical protein
MYFWDFMDRAQIGQNYAEPEITVSYQKTNYQPIAIY